MKIGLIILSAGYSERMGVLKPLLPVGEESALHRAVGLGKAEKVHCISVVTGYRCEDVEAELSACRGKNIRHVYNRHFDEGMFTSVKAGIHSLPGDLDGFFLLPVDHCGVRPETVEKIIAAFILENGESVVYPTYKGLRGHPPLIPYGFAAGLRTYDGEDGMRGYLSQFPAVDIEVDDAGTVMDMDTPKDYEALLRYLGLPAFPDEAACRALMKKYDMSEQVIAHCEQVNRLAQHMAGLLREKAVSIDTALLASGCLLHDVLRSEPEHAHAGAKLLLKEGYPGTARLVDAHMDLPKDYVPKPDELALLYLADKLCRGGTVTPIDKTIDNLKNRYADNAEALAQAEKRLARARQILDMLGENYGIHEGILMASV